MAFSIVAKAVIITTSVSGCSRLEGLEHLEPALLADAQVGEDQVELLRPRRSADGRRGLRERGHLVPGLAQEDLEVLAHRALVVHHQDSRHRSSPARPGPPARPPAPERLSTGGQHHRERGPVPGLAPAPAPGRRERRRCGARWPSPSPVPRSLVV